MKAKYLPSLKKAVLPEDVASEVEVRSSFMFSITSAEKILIIII